MVVDFTYRRTLLTNMFGHLLKDYLAKSLTVEELVGTLRGSAYLPGVDRNETYMPVTTDIELLSKAYPEKVTPVDTRRNHLSSPAFSEYHGIRGHSSDAIKESAVAV